MYKINLLCFNRRQRNRDKIGSPQCRNTFQLHFTRVVSVFSRSVMNGLSLKLSISSIIRHVSSGAEERADT